MSTYAAEIVGDTVARVLVTDTVAWCSENLGGEWIECKRDGSIRGCYPGPGFAYDRTADVFIAPAAPIDP